VTLDLRVIPLFANLEEAELAPLAACAKVRACPKNVVVVNEGDDSDSLYLILAGKVKIYLSDDSGKQMYLDIKGPGEYFGEMALDAGKRSASVMSIEPSQFAIIGREDFEKFLLAHPVLAVELLKRTIQLARTLNDSVRNLAMLDVYGRTARMLLDLAVELDGKLVIPERLTQQDMASRVGASREMVNRILNDLKIGGYISVEGRRITINRRPPARW
jgi:CRP/FNR family cyclic AMP-dependent transcriptional regulator